MRERSSRLKDRDIFRITEQPEETADSGDAVDIIGRLDMLKAEILKLGKSQIQTRVFTRSEYQSLREAIEMLSTDRHHMAEMVIKDLLSIADGLDAGIRAADAISSHEVDSWINGMEIVRQRVMELLRKLDVHPLPSVGNPFDPALHMAVAVEHTQEVDDNIVLEEQRRGYMCNGKVIRHAEVIVNKRSHQHAVQVEEDGN